MRPDAVAVVNPSIRMTRDLFWPIALAASLIIPSALAGTNGGVDKAQVVERVEEYFDRLDQLSAEFTLTTGDGQTKNGQFYLNRPGKMRFEYSDSGDFIVADGRFIYFWDDELTQQSQARIGNTLAGFILKPELNIGQDVILTNWDMGKNTLITTLNPAENPGLGKISLYFSIDPDHKLTMRRWRVIDAQGHLTEVHLNDTNHTPVLSDDLFAFQRPDQQQSILEQR
jgi:outer membrane lipoprotein-sorting protein